MKDMQRRSANALSNDSWMKRGDERVLFPVQYQCRTLDLAELSAIEVTPGRIEVLQSDNIALPQSVERCAVGLAHRIRLPWRPRRDGTHGLEGGNLFRAQVGVSAPYDKSLNSLRRCRGHDGADISSIAPAKDGEFMVAQ